MPQGWAAVYWLDIHQAGPVIYGTQSRSYVRVFLCSR